MDTTTKRIEYIDALRGFTMILVIYYHIASYSLGNEEMGFNDVIEKFRMPTFFFISGWVFYKANRIWDARTITTIIRKKFMVQIIPFLFFMLIYLYVFNYLDASSFGSDKKGYWFTFVLFEFFVIYSLFEFILNRRNTNEGEIRVMLAVLSLSIIAFYYATIYTRYASELGNLKTILGLFSFVKFKHFIFFYIGSFIRRHFHSFIKHTDNKYIIALIILVYFALAMNSSVYSMKGLEYIAYLITGITGICIIFTFFRKKEALFSKDRTLGRILQYIGRRTLDIYLLHYFIIPYNLQQIATWLMQSENKTFDMLIILFLALWIIALSLLLSNIIRLSPFLAHYLFGVKSGS